MLRCPKKRTRSHAEEEDGVHPRNGEPRIRVPRPEVPRIDHRMVQHCPDFDGDRNRGEKSDCRGHEENPNAPRVVDLLFFILALLPEDDFKEKKESAEGIRKRPTPEVHIEEDRK